MKVFWEIEGRKAFDLNEKMKRKRGKPIFHSTVACFSRVATVRAIYLCSLSLWSSLLR